jgi:hypothetical protein
VKQIGFSSLGNILDKYQVDEGKQRRISREWQDYAYRLALDLDDIAHTSIYMRMGKNVPRYILEEARVFVKGSMAKSKARLFMWKVKQLKEEKREKG